ncbi:MAG TPA: DUF1015 domain-containing protein [Candidatus Limnocylindria bacterium]
MPPVRAFRPITYAPQRFASPEVAARIRLPDEPGARPGAGRAVSDLTEVVCPPYDVIDEPLRERLLARDPHNAVRLEFPPGEDPHHAAAAALRDWLTDGTLARRPAAAVYYYAFATADMPDEPTVPGVLAQVLLEPYGGDVRAHEHTMPGPKADRLAHLQATRTQVSPILAIYFDASERYRHVMGRAWTDEWRARDEDGLLHTAGEVEADDRLLGYLSRQRLYIADGHHRYETALAYQAEVRANPALAGAAPGELAADWVMMVLVNAELEELRVLPTHRLLRRVDAEALERLARGEVDPWRSGALAEEELLTVLGQGDAEPVFGLLLPGGRSFVLRIGREAAGERMRRERVSTAVAKLDLAVLQAALLDDVLTIGSADVAAGERLTYTRSATEARSAVEAGEVQAAILVRPTSLEQIAAVASAGDVMPQKSTYFYPKLLTGMAFNPLEG